MKSQMMTIKRMLIDKEITAWPPARMMVIQKFSASWWVFNTILWIVTVAEEYTETLPILYVPECILNMVCATGSDITRNIIIYKWENLDFLHPYGDLDQSQNQWNLIWTYLIFVMNFKPLAFSATSGISCKQTDKQTNGQTNGQTKVMKIIPQW